MIAFLSSYAHIEWLWTLPFFFVMNVDGEKGWIGFKHVCYWSNNLFHTYMCYSVAFLEIEASLVFCLISLLWCTEALGLHHPRTKIKKFCTRRSTFHWSLRVFNRGLGPREYDSFSFVLDAKPCWTEAVNEPLPSVFELGEAKKACARGYHSSASTINWSFFEVHGG